MNSSSDWSKNVEPLKFSKAEKALMGGVAFIAIGASVLTLTGNLSDVAESVAKPVIKAGTYVAETVLGPLKKTPKVVGGTLDNRAEDASYKKDLAILADGKNLINDKPTDAYRQACKKIFLKVASSAENGVKGSLQATLTGALNNCTGAINYANALKDLAILTDGKNIVNDKPTEAYRQACKNIFLKVANNAENGVEGRLQGALTDALTNCTDAINYAKMIDKKRILFNAPYSIFSCQASECPPKATPFKKPEKPAYSGNKFDFMLE